MSNILAVIPARYASTRFPGKPLVQIHGKTMIQRVYEQVSKCSGIGQIVVATDDERIATHVQNFGGTAQMTDAAHPSGTDRCAEVARSFPDALHIINVQGDEPFIQVAQIELLLETLLSGPEVQIATLAKKIDDASALFNPNIVKAVLNHQSDALYFSRHPIPFQRGVAQEEWLSNGHFLKHIGIYGFEKSTLLSLAALPPGILERAESLEQLRWLEHGYKIRVGITPLETLGIDTPEDLERISHFLSPGT